jgi:protocatechuate 3,4-dioxygenase beta subunit
VLGLLLACALGSGEGGCRCGAGKHGQGAADAGRPAAAAWIAGRVTDRKDRPVPEARVLAFAIGAQAAAAVEAATDADGRFRIERLATGPHRVLVEAAGFPAAEAEAVTAPADGVAIQVDGEGSSVVGRVFAAGAPTAGARVLLAPDAGGPVRETTTRAGGGFAFGGLGAGRYALRAATADLASPVLRGVDAGEGPGAAAIRLDMVAGQAIAGRVADDAGTALAGVDVRIEAGGAVPGEDPLPTLVSSDAAGAFAARVAPGRYRLTAARPGYVLRRAPTVDDKTPAAPPVVLELVRGARVAGRVLDGRGGPAAGATVRCVASAIEDLTVQIGPLPLAAEAAALPSGAGRALGSTRVAVADRSGAFAVADLIPGRYRFEIAHPGSEPLRSDEFVLAPGERRDAGKLALRLGFPVVGRVTDESGAPIEGARAVVASAAASPASTGLFALTSSAGRFELALPAGAYRLAISAAGRGATQVSVDVVAGTAPPPLEVKLSRAEAALEGMVRDDGGRPLARARLSVWPPAGAGDLPPPSGSGPATLASGVADVGGHFRLAQLPAGDLRLEVQHPDYPTSVHATTAGKYALITVPFPGGIAGEVRAKATGAAIARGRLDAEGPGGAKATTAIRKDGSFRLLRLAPGRWRLTTAAAGFRNAEQELDVPASSALGEASIRELRIELDAS